jgi:predicted transcriptional regulator
MKSYLECLEEYSKEKQVSLKIGFDLAGVPSSTYYRVKHGQDIRYTTARKVYDAINYFSALQKKSCSD